MTAALPQATRHRALTVLVVLAAALAIDAAIVAVRYAVIVESDRAGDAAVAIAIAVFGVAAALVSFVSPGKPSVVRGLAAALLMPFALVVSFVGLLSLADGELLGASCRLVAGVLLLALIVSIQLPGVSVAPGVSWLGLEASMVDR